MSGRTKRLFAILPYFILVAALVLLFRELRGMDWGAFFTQLWNWPLSSIALALAVLAVNTLAWASYDWVSLRQLEEKVPLREIMRTTFHAFSITNLIGHSYITGLGIRVREYSKYQIPLSKITQVVMMNLEMWWMGFLFLLGVVLVNLESAELREYSAYLSKGVGIGLLGLTAVYLLACLKLSGRVVRFRRIEFYLPDLESGTTKLLIATTDVLLVSLTLYVLLPPDMNISFAQFLALHLVAHFLGIVSAVPGGLGVLEGVLLKLLMPYGSQTSILASILLFRTVHYLLPAAMTVAFELVSHGFKRKAEKV